MASGGTRAELVEGSMQGCSGPRISSSRRVVLLRRCTMGQVGWRINGGEEFRWRAVLPVMALR
jgi:hypothetical protein